MVELVEDEEDLTVVEVEEEGSDEPNLVSPCLCLNLN